MLMGQRIAQNALCRFRSNIVMAPCRGGRVFRFGQRDYIFIAALAKADTRQRTAGLRNRPHDIFQLPELGMHTLAPAFMVRYFGALRLRAHR